MLPVAVGLLVLGSALSVRADEAPVRVVQTGDGSLFVVSGGQRQRLVPDFIPDEELVALPEGEPMFGQIAFPAPAPPLPPAVIGATPPPAAVAGEAAPAGSVNANGRVLTVVGVRRPVPPPSRSDVAKAGYELLEISVRVDNTTTLPFSVSASNFKVQVVDLVLYDRASTAAPDDLKTVSLLPGRSMAGKLFFEVPVGLPHTTLVWTSAGPWEVDIR